MMPLRIEGTLERADHSPQCPRVRARPGHRRRRRAGLWLGAGFAVFPARGGVWSLLWLLPIKRGWHFRARQGRWLPALEVSIWPLSRRCLPGPSPLSSADPDRGPQRAIVILPAPQWGHSGALQRPLWRAPPPLLGALGRSLCLCGWGLWLWQKQPAARAALLKTGLLMEGTEMPHTSRDSGVLCPHRAPAPAGAPRLPRGPHLRAEQQGLPYVH